MKKKYKTVITILNKKIVIDNYYGVLREVSQYCGLSTMSLKEARDFFHGKEGLSMYDVIITKADENIQICYPIFK